MGLARLGVYKSYMLAVDWCAIGTAQDGWECASHPILNAQELSNGSFWFSMALGMVVMDE